jgi:hypothetical protein
MYGDSTSSMLMTLGAIWASGGNGMSVQSMGTTHRNARRNDRRER